MQELQEEEERDRAQREQNAREMQTADDAERAAREQERRELIDQLQSSNVSARKVMQQAAQKRMAQRAVNEVPRPVPLMRSRMTSAIADPPYQPLADNWWDYSDLYTLRNDYDDPMSDIVRSDINGVFRAGGYIVQEAWTRAISSALAGIDMLPARAEDPDVVMDNA
jgi:CDK-activating kinase assembly factor MAT1